MSPRFTLSGSVLLGSLLLGCLLLGSLLAAVPAAGSEAQQAAEPAPEAVVESPAGAAVGEGPFGQLILRGVILIDGTGAPPRGPVDVVVRGERIEAVAAVGPPGVVPDPRRRPILEDGGRELDLEGMYVLPGLIDLFGHVAEPRDYTLKLWLGHGITTVREPFCAQGIEPCLRIKEASDDNRLAAPRYVPYLYFGLGPEGTPRTARRARDWVAEAAKAGADGVKLRSGSPEVVKAALAEARAQGLGSSVHLDPVRMPGVGLLDAAAWGAGMVEHFYGLPEALHEGSLPPLPPGHNDADEQHRFAWAGRLWRTTAAPGSERWKQVLEALLEADVTLMPTLSLYEANRDLARASQAEWHKLYTLPSLWKRFLPARGTYAAPWLRWTSEDEAAWSFAFRRWGDFLREFAARGGRVATGSDSGFLFNLHGFGLIREMELLREAGLPPMEVIRAATQKAAEALRMEASIGTVEPGKRADLLVVAENPLDDLKVLYGTGALRVDENDRRIRVGGVVHTLKNGVLFDARKQLAEVRQMVGEAWELEGGAPAPLGLGETLAPAP